MLLLLTQALYYWGSSQTRGQRSQCKTAALQIAQDYPDAPAHSIFRKNPPLEMSIYLNRVIRPHRVPGPLASLDQFAPGDGPQIIIAPKSLLPASIAPAQPLLDFTYDDDPWRALLLPPGRRGDPNP